MLIVGDICAVSIHRSNVQWDHIRKLMPTVVIGLFAGTGLLIWLGKSKLNVLNPLIGGIVLLMLAVSLLRGKLGDRLVPSSPIGTVFTGALAGFTTMVANAAGPVMSIYMTSTDMNKKQLIGTSAWYFLIVNTVKIPFLVFVTCLVPSSPLFDRATLMFDVCAIPVIVGGAIVGRAVFDKIPQRLFNSLILVLAAVASLKLLLSDVDFSHLMR